MSILKTFRVATWGAKTALKGAWAAVTSPRESFATVTDLRRLLQNFDKIPGLDEQIPDPAFLNKSLLILQMGRVALCISHDQSDRTDADLLHMDPLSEDAINATIGEGQFLVKAISEDENEKTKGPAISLMINTANFSKNPDKITSDLLVETLKFQIKRVPVVGEIGATILAWPVRKIADFLFGIIYEQTRNLGLWSKNDSVEDKVLPTQDAAPQAGKNPAPH